MKQDTVARKSRACLNGQRSPAPLPAGILLIISTLIFGCGSGGNNGPGETQAPTIAVQPTNQSVPMGLGATFAVAANGMLPFHYQWNRNGVPISGATTSPYTTSAVQFADSGSTFSVTITNSVASVTSSAATLTVTARAPQPGDLRFQQVDAASTVNSYEPSSAVPTTILEDRTSFTLPNTIGTPLYVNNNCCLWQFTPFVSRAVNGINTGYIAQDLNNLQAILNGTFNSATPDLSTSDVVITSISLTSQSGDLPPTNIGQFALSYVQATQDAGFNMAQHTVPPADFQAAASQEGAQGRVITAVSYDTTGQVYYISYGWQSDPSTAYEAKVATATLDTLATVATNLATQGYIITAVGSEDPADGSGVLLVGTRVQGDTMPRPLMVVPGGGDPTQLFSSGYAIVGVADNSSSRTWIGER